MIEKIITITLGYIMPFINLYVAFVLVRASRRNMHIARENYQNALINKKNAEENLNNAAALTNHILMHKVPNEDQPDNAS